jgi:hypothetical protein
VTGIGTIAGIRVYPVKSMQGQAVEHAEVTEQGLAGDRAFALIDSETGKVVSAKSARLFPEILEFAAAYDSPPRAGEPLPPVVIELPGGQSVRSDSPAADRVLSEALGRAVTLARSAPEDFRIDQYYADVEGAAPAERRGTVGESKLGASWFAAAGMPSPVAQGAFFDLFPVSVITTSTLAALRELCPESDFDERRFRMNLIVETPASGFVENAWTGRELFSSEGLQLKVTLPDPRCVMTTLAQGGLPKDLDVMRTLVQHNRLQVADAGRYPCAGVYAVVTAPGGVRVGDTASLS